jgi:LysM repeat protein
VATPEVTATPDAPAQQLYRVEEGDTLTQIARLYGTTVQQLAELNDIADPERIENGTLLVLPPAPPGAAPTSDEGLRAEAERHCPPQGAGSCRAQYLAAAEQSEPRALCVSGETRWFFENPQGGVGTDCSKDGFTIVAILGGS